MDIDYVLCDTQSCPCSFQAILGDRSEVSCLRAGSATLLLRIAPGVEA